MKFRKLILINVLIAVVVFTGCKQGKLRDADGNKYKTVTIGEQVWMKENLRTTKYNDGTPIKMITDYDEWAGYTAPAYSWYNNDSTYKETFGALYNWYAVDTKKLCPAGWHVPVDSDWVKLVFYLGNSEIAGDKLKAAGTYYWREPNSEADNSSGFTALPGGFRSYNGTFNYTGMAGYWWTSTEYSATNVYFYNLRYKFPNVYKFISEKNNGFSVRCIKD